jgi:beta-ribofuranosylaminobenzene 5'-phosphate synthase
MIRVRTPSRLHFGLLSLPSSASWPNFQGHEVVPARRFGSVGLMIQAPGVQLTTQPAAAWSAEGPLAERALAYAQRFIQTLAPEIVQPQHLVVEASAAEHVGLGTGTQLGLAVARALALAFGLRGLSVVDLAQRVGRGARSALGLHGFAQGGFLVEGGKGSSETAAPLVARVAFPQAWRIVLVLPPWETGLHGTAEEEAFGQLRSAHIGQETTDSLCRLVLLGILPALVESDLLAFGEALYDFNARVGETFRTVQRGTYASQAVAEVIAFVRQQGVRGVGQSSWGPVVFAATADAEQAENLVGRMRARFGLAATEVFVVAPCNRGAVVGSGGC